MTGVFGLYTQIQRNRLISAALLAGFFLLLQALSFSGVLIFEAVYGTHKTLGALLRDAVHDMRVVSLLAASGCFFWLYLAWTFHERIVDAAVGARALSQSAAPHLYRQLEILCIARGLSVPRLKVIETPALNAFASGLSDKNYCVTVTRGLIDALDDREMNAVLAHELTHIRNRDTQVMLVAIVFAGVFSLVGQWLVLRGNGAAAIRPMRGSSGQGRGVAPAAIVLAIAIFFLSWGLSALSKFALSRAREYLADAGAVELTKDPDALVAALRKIDQHCRFDAPEQMAAFFIADPTQALADRYLSTHPSIESRIAALVRYAGAQPPIETAPSPGK